VDPAVPARSDRREEVRAGLERVRERVAAACVAAGRRIEEVTVVVVTKTYPPSDLELLADLGVRDVGENRDQEAAAKYDACRSRPATAELTWHFIGRLQTNKARSVTRYAALVHSVDRVGLAAALGRGAREHGRGVGALVQVSLDGDPARGGALPQDVPAVAEALAAQVGLQLRGLMAVAPVGVDPARAFAALPPLLERIRREHPGADVLSAGMSGDLEAALGAGATHLRVGTAVLGARPPLG